MLYQDKSFIGLSFCFCLALHCPKPNVEVNLGKRRDAALPEIQRGSEFG
jgi:hypothetical protein